MILINLPGDILFLVCSHLPVPDLLAFGQICRALHAFILQDYIWHQIDTHLPLNTKGMDISSYSAIELHRMHVQALRLEHNWSKKTSAIRGIEKIHHRDLVFQIQFVADLVITLARSPVVAYLSVWKVLEGENPRRMSYINLPGASVFSAAIQGDSNEIIIGVLFKTVLLRVYSISLNGSDNNVVETRPTCLADIPQKDTRDIAYEVHVYKHIVVAAIAHFRTPYTIPLYRFIICDSKTREHTFVDLQIPPGLNRLHFCLCDNYLILVGVHDRNFIVRYYNISDLLQGIQSSSRTQPSRKSTFSIISDSQNTIDFYLSAYCKRPGPPVVTILSFYSSILLNHESGNGYVFSLEWDEALQHTMTEKTFLTPPGAVTDITCFGSTGRRAVWLQRVWDTDSFRVMKSAFPDHSEDIVATALLTNNMVLPFELSRISAMFFEEESGRLALAIHTGDIYILEF